MNKLLTRAEQLFIILSLLHYSGGPLFLLLMGGGVSTSSSIYSVEDVDTTLIKLGFLGIYFVTFVLLGLHWRKALNVLSSNWYILAAVGVCVASIFWSVSFVQTFNGIIALAGTTGFGVYLAARYSILQQIQLVAWTCTIAAVLSVLFIVALPSYGIHSEADLAGNWRGIYSQKNTLGQMMVISSTAFFFLLSNLKRKKFYLFLGLALSTILLLFSQSTASLLNLSFVIMAFCVCITLRWRFNRMLLALTALLTIGGSLLNIILTYKDTILVSIGKDPTLTGRTDLWLIVWQLIRKNPLLGYGYNAFWQGWDGPSDVVWLAFPWLPPNAHNGFLDVWLSVGALGLIVFLVGLGKSFILSYNYLRSTRSIEGLWPMTFLVFMTMSAFAESTFLQANNLIWILYVTATFSVLKIPMSYPNQKISSRKRSKSSSAYTRQAS
jgi:O-antigen ligase